MVKVYRFNLSDEFKPILIDFVEIHKYDDIKTYKDAWEKYVQKKHKYFKKEIDRLKTNGYTGDVINKMYKSARYYWRKKPDDLKNNSITIKEYIRFDKYFIEKISDHILRNKDCKNYTPANGFSEFRNIFKDDIEKQIKLYNNLNKDVIMCKIKKTYKNRYYIISRNLK